MFQNIRKIRKVFFNKILFHLFKFFKGVELIKRFKIEIDRSYCSLPHRNSIKTFNRLSSDLPCFDIPGFFPVTPQENYNYLNELSYSKPPYLRD